MKIFKNTCKYDISDTTFLSFDISEALFFDIETTGFSVAHTKLYLIGCLYYDEKDDIFRTIQWFSDTSDAADEAKLISAFFEFSQSRRFRYLVHFNGDGFDIPYISRKCDKLGIKSCFGTLSGIDLYKTAFALRNVLKLPNLKQKTLEGFLGVSRTDKYSGDELIKIYESFQKTGNAASLALLLLHNLDDIKGLLQLLDILNYRELFDGCFNVNSIIIENHEAVIELLLKCPLVSRISAGNSSYYMTAFGEKARIRINIYADELKYFYPNYKDYYYLPKEDCSIHKSVAFYVDKNFRTQAKAANCYSKKTGRFLPQQAEIISPYFKIEYGDKTTYFEITDEFLEDKSSIKKYAVHILELLLR